MKSKLAVVCTLSLLAVPSVSAQEPRTCTIQYTADEIPALAAERLWYAHYRDISWRDALRTYNARKAELEKNLGGTVEVAPGPRMTEPGNRLTGADVYSSQWDGSSPKPETPQPGRRPDTSGDGSTLSIAQLGHVPYDALAFLHNADDWRSSVAEKGCPGPDERPQAPKDEPWQLTVDPNVAVAPKEWQGALVALAALVGLIAAASAIAQMIPVWEKHLRNLLPR